jgi:hypothetical protein
MDPKEHPVWDVYNLLRTARLNVKYYSARLAFLQRSNFWLEIVLAISAPSSAIAGLWFWQYSMGQVVWKIFAVIAAFFAILKPFLKLPERIKRFEETLTGYRTLDNDLQNIAVKIRQQGTYDEEIKGQFDRAFNRKIAISTQEPEVREKIKLKNNCEAEVLSELPHAHFYIPEV